MLPNVRPSIGANVIILHVTLKLEVVRACEVRVTRFPSVVLLQIDYGSSHRDVLYPVLEFGDGEICEPIFGLHCWQFSLREKYNE